MSLNSYQVKAGDTVTAKQDIYMVTENLEEGELFTKEQVEKYLIEMASANEQFTIAATDGGTVLLQGDKDTLHVSYEELSSLFN